MIPKNVPQLWKNFLIGIIIALLPIFLIDNWLPYALLSHYNYPVDSKPAIFQQFNAKVENINFTTDDNIKISGWWIPSPINLSENPTLIVLHSLGGTRQDFLKFNLPIWQRGFNLALIDMRSHGKSGGEYFTYGFHERKDVSRLIDFLEKYHKEESQNIALMGISAGGAVAISSAAYDKRIQALITISAFADLNNTIAKQVPWLPSFWRKRAIANAEEIAEFNIAEISPINQIKKVNCPILIVHGTLDKYIPFVNGKKLFNTAKGEKLFYAVEGGNHSTILDKGGEVLRNRIIEFVLRN
ncbi:prolyl oligopeptidase family protein [Rivularia sp. PCC 7116]|uniref:alpha/beta hydrolase n=1 Tax=Rivularia sp. PCC 7116 TaxID=373994 RepID=UPI00029F2B43|nr:alpha/beta hydrolase [Rivularia sp. PCC 7116]AFY58645.1 prolyl oligopeptidase family protein [Rivularia sp. PCC 7116]